MSYSLLFFLEYKRLGGTLQQIIDQRSTLAVAMWNDEVPAPFMPMVVDLNETSGTSGHTKGVLVGDANGGFWLTHSMPLFPLLVRDPLVDALKVYLHPSNSRKLSRRIKTPSVGRHQLRMANLFSVCRWHLLTMLRQRQRRCVNDLIL